MSKMPAATASPESEKRIDKFKSVFSTSWKLIKLVWSVDKPIFLLNLVAVLIPAITPLIIAYVFKLVIDLIVATIGGAPLDSQRLYYLLGLLLVVSFMNRMAFAFQDYASRIFFTKVPLYLNELILSKVANLDLKYFEDSNFRDVLQKVRDSHDFRPQQLIHNIFFTLQSILQMLVALIAILSLNPILTLLLLVVAIPDLYNQLYFSNIAWGIWNDQTPYRKKYDYLTHLIQKGEAIKEIKIFATSTRFLKEIYNLQFSFFKDNKLVLDRQLRANTAFNFLDSLVYLGVLIFIVLEAISKRITVGDISFYQSVIINFNNGVSGLFRNFGIVYDQSLYVRYIFQLLDIKNEIVSPPNAIKIDINKAPKVEFKDVSFTYPGSSDYIFKNFSLIINPGEKIALVGENGVGKTTLIKLLARFYDVDEGEILINGHNIKDLDLETWHQTIGVLFQDFIKYEYPVKDNIYFGRVWEKQDLVKIIDAAKSAGADPMIKKFEQEYEQMLGKTFEKGLELSGGQWQKIALSRAFFRNAPILVLDEPTAAIDAKAESEIFNRVEKLSKDKSVIIISHRFSTVRNADKIYVIENGRIIESGNHHQLMKVNGQYATLFKLQAKGYQ